MSQRPVIIVLAAGRGSRFAGHSHKLLQPLGETTVLGKTLDQAMRSHLPVVAVATQAVAAECARWVAGQDLIVLPAVGEGASEPLGMGFSIAAGVAARPHAGGWLVLPGDMPLVQPQTLLAVAEGLKDHLVAYAQHHGRKGHPVAFAQELFSDLVQLTGDEGARRVMARYPAQPVEVPDPGVLVDVDTVADWERLTVTLASS